ncbi:MAG: hypothetical protein VKJ46_15995 [Leptolyngbyaceae bacterium]|nr:hypothetical protein [Leptolyngbyaceae bacterium]
MIGQPILDLGNTNNWELVWPQFEFAAVQTGPSSYIRIPEFFCPVQLTKPILAISLSTSQGGVKLAGFVNQKIQTGLTVGGQPDAYALYRRKVYFEDNQIIFIPDIVDSYSVSISVPYWIRHIKGAMWMYTGIISDSITERLKAVQLSIEGLQ